MREFSQIKFVRLPQIPDHNDESSSAALTPVPAYMRDSDIVLILCSIVRRFLKHEEMKVPCKNLALG